MQSLLLLKMKTEIMFGKQDIKGGIKMFYVYSKYIKTGREDFIRTYDNAEDAVRKIANNYKIDKDLCQLGEYYYFMVRR